MTENRFRKVAEMLLEVSSNMSGKAYTNFQLKKEIEEREKVNLKLQKNQELLYITLHSIGDAVITTNKHGLINDMNRVAEELCGWKLADAKRKRLKDVFEIIHADTRLEAHTDLEEALNNTEITEISNHKILISKHKSNYQIEGTVSPIKNKEDEIVGNVLVFSDVTEKNKIEEKLRESEKKYSILFQESPDAYLTISDGVIVDCNKETEKLLRSKKNEIIGKSPQALSPQFQPNGVASAIAAAEYMEKALKLGKHTFDWLHSRFDGSELFVEVTLAAMELDGKQTFFVTWRDVSKRKHAEEMLLNERLLLRTLIDNVPDAIYTKDLECRKTLANTADLINLGAETEQEVLNKNDFDFFPVEIAEKFYADDLQVLKLGKVVINREEYLKAETGEPKWLLTSKLPIYNKNKQIVGLLGIGRDITIRRKTEQALRESESFLKETQIIAKLGSYSFDIKTNQWAGSEVFDSIVGTDDTCPKTLDTWLKIIHPDCLEMMMDYFTNEVIGQKQPFNKEYKIISINDGVEKWVHGIGELIFNDKGEALKMIGTIQDITDLKKTEIALEEQLRFQQILMDISSEYINLPLDKIESTIQISLRNMAEFVGADRAYIFDYQMNAKLSNNTYEWCAADVIPNIDKLKTIPISKMIGFDKHQKGEIVDISSPSDLKNEELKQWWETQNLKCFITIPMMLNGNSIGFVGFDSLKKIHLYSDNEKRLLKTFAQMLVNIHLRRTVDESLQNERLLLRTVIDNIPDTIYAKDLNLKKTLANKAELELLGVSSEAEVLGKTDAAFYDAAFANRAMDIDVEIIETETPHFNCEGSFVDRNNQKRWFLSSKLPLRNKDNQIIGLVGIGHDITNRKSAEEALRKSEEKYRNIFENVQDVFFQLNLAGQVFEVSPSITKLYGYDREDIIGHAISDFYASSIDESLDITALINQQRVSDFELKLKTKNGGVKSTLLNAQVIFNSDGQPDHIDGTIRDISIRKKAEEAMLESERKFRSILENSPFHIWASDGKVYTFVNKTYCSFTGLEEEEMTLTNVWRNHLHPDDYDKANKIWLDAWKHKKEHYNFFRLRNKDGVYRDISSHVVPIFNEQNQFLHFQGFNIDVTERNQADVALNNSQQELKKFAAHLQSVREEERIMLAREIHDELGQILIAIKIDTGLLKQKTLKIVDNSNYSEILTKFDALSGLVDNTIKTTRKIMTDLRPEVLYLLGFVEAAKLHISKFQERHAIICRFKTEIPKLELNEQHSVALFRILQEALTNIVKHANATEVSIVIAQIDPSLIMEITDNGVGIDQNQKVRTDSYGMIGMKERVFLLEGKLTITGRPGKGTTVKVTLPY